MGDKAVNIVFLDIDGVLNTTGKLDSELILQLKRVVQKSGGHPKTRIVLSSSWRYTRDRVIFLNEIFRHFGVFNPPESKNSPEQEGKIREGKTDYVEWHKEYQKLPQSSQKSRTYEILTWLEYNAIGFAVPELGSYYRAQARAYAARKKKWAKKAKETLGWTTIWRLKKKIYVKNFVVIDDLYLDGCRFYGQVLAGHFVHTFNVSGLNEEKVERERDGLKKGTKTQYLILKAEKALKILSNGRFDNIKSKEVAEWKDKIRAIRAENKCPDPTAKKSIFESLCCEFYLHAS